MPFAFLQSLFLIVKYRPFAVFGVGGYASLPVVFLASLFGIKTYIWEPNAVPGMTNRILAKYVSQTLVVFESSKQNMNCKNVAVAGFPVRENIENQVHKKTNDSFNILVFGGSLGARGINNIIKQAVLSDSGWLEGIKIFHQTGKLDYLSLSRAYKNAPPEIAYSEYINDMENKYAWADLVICRAGAGTVAELAVCGKASILVPFPGAADNHQQKNAENLVNSNAAQMILQKDLNAKDLIQQILRLKQNREKLRELEQNIKRFHVGSAAKNIAQAVLSGEDL